MENIKLNSSFFELTTKEILITQGGASTVANIVAGGPVALTTGLVGALVKR